MGDSFTKLTDPSILPTGFVRGASFSPDGKHLCLAHGTSPFATIYKREGDTFTKVTFSDTLPSLAEGCAFSPNGKLLSIVTTTSPFVSIYRREGDSFSRLPDPIKLPSGYSTSVAFSLDSKRMIVGTTTTPFLCIYEVNDKEIIRLSDVWSSTGTVNAVDFSYDNYLSVAEAASPYLGIYKANYIYENNILLSSGDKYYSFINRKYENLIPKMTSNSSSAPIVPIFSTEWTNGIQVGAGSAFNAFDGDINKVSGWSTSSNAFIGIDWGTAKLIERYRITSHPTLSNTPPTGWIFEASQDNSTWITLDTKTGITWGKGEMKEFIISNTSYYRYYRLRSTVNTTFAVGELEMLQLEAPSLVEYDIINEKTVVEFSENSMLDFNFNMSQIKDIKIFETPLGSGKTFEHIIDMSKRRVDKITLD
ncbi:hypothetical protein MT997_13580 [Paenibacillus sp. OVF10]|nr:hypothetical protein MT997_13580 [Paenibacillus sp. OVF10]